MSDVGLKLENGAVALDVEWLANDGAVDTGIGLFLWAESPHPFVIWSLSRKHGSDWIDSWNGRYYGSLPMAVETYIKYGGVL